MNCFMPASKERRRFALHGPPPPRPFHGRLITLRVRPRATDASFRRLVSNWDRNCELRGDAIVYIDLCSRRTNRDQERISCRSLPSLKGRLLLPPAAYREYSDCIAVCKCGRAATPNVRMDRAAIADRTQDPVVTTGHSNGLPRLLVLSSLVDALTKFIEAL